MKLRTFLPMTGHQIEKKVDNEMETGMLEAFQRVMLKIPQDPKSPIPWQLWKMGTV